jgi:hypothetical protein
MPNNFRFKDVTLNHEANLEILDQFLLFYFRHKRSILGFDNKKSLADKLVDRRFNWRPTDFERSYKGFDVYFFPWTEFTMQDRIFIDNRRTARLYSWSLVLSSLFLLGKEVLKTFHEIQYVLIATPEHNSMIGSTQISSSLNHEWKFLFQLSIDCSYILG